jgi:hypothetical protein
LSLILAFCGTAMAASVPPTIPFDPNDAGKVRGLAGAKTTIRFLERGVIQIQVRTKSPLRYTTPFTWIRTANMEIAAVISTDGGTCRLVDGNLSCRGPGNSVPPRRPLTVTFSTTVHPAGTFWNCGLSVLRGPGPISHGPPRSICPG